MKEMLTATRMTTLLACPRRHYWRYEVGLKAVTDAMALRFGTVWHAGMEARWQGLAYPAALVKATGAAVAFAEIDLVTLAGMLAGYYAKYSGDAECIASLHAETEFCMALPGSRTFDSAGKIDGLGVLKDGRLALLEHKTCAEDISPEGEYWARLRFNPQIFQYLLAARALGWDVVVAIYDVARKPAIKQKQTETVEQFGERLVADTQERSEFYFARREVPILDQDVAEFEVQRLELSRLILLLRAASRRARRPEQAWPRNCGAMTCRFCEFESFCMQNISVDPQQPPAGFRVGKVFPELSNVQGGVQ